MIGETLGSYQILAPLGEGGMGAVYIAQHALLGRRAAIKVLQPQFSSNPELIERFFNEARLTTQIRHPGLVEIFDFGKHTNGSAFIVMELLEGESLASRLRRERLPLDLTVELTRQIASALGAAHAKSIVHRDLKPDNVFLTPDDAVAFGTRAKILDFGIAKLVDKGAGALHTHTNMIIGTPLFMSPEQCRGAGFVDHRTDIYALGCMMFAMACGRAPFDEGAPGDIMASHLREPAPQPSQVVAGLPPGFDLLVTRMLSKTPEARPQTMQNVIEALNLVSARPSSGNFYQLPQPSPSGPQRPVDNSSGATRILDDSATPPSEVAARSAHRQPTTLSGAASEIIPGSRSTARSTGAKWIAVSAFVIVGLAGGSYALFHSRGKDETPAVAAVPPVAAAVTPAARLVSLRLESTPPGATVTRLSDGKRVGTTPATIEQAAAAGEIAFKLELSGYDDQRLTLSTERDGMATAALARHEAAAHGTNVVPRKHAPKPASNADSKPASNAGAKPIELERKVRVVNPFDN